MDLPKLVYLIIAVAYFACSSASDAAGRSNLASVARPNHLHNSRRVFIVRQPFPIQRSPASVDAVRPLTPRSRIDSRIDSRF
jgi:hypothetical protein